MSAAKIFHHPVFGKIKIFFCPSEQKIVAELKSAVEKSDHAVLVGENDTIDMVLHVAGFALPSWSESLNLTTRIQDYLELAKNKKAKFVIVLPDKDNDFIKVAVSLVEQFARLFKLNYEIVLVSTQMSNREQTQTALDKIFHGYLTLTPDNPIPTRSVEKHPKSKKEKSFFQKLGLIVLGFFLIPWLIFAASYAATIGLLACWQSRCQRAAIITANIAQVTSAITLGSARLPVLSSVAARSNSLFTLTTGLSLKLTTGAGLLDLSTRKGDLSRSLESADYLLADLETLELSGEWLNRWRSDRLDQVTGLRQLVVKLDNIAADLPTLLGVKKPLKYAILFQDNTELRATGGFIQGFALLRVADGRATDIQYFSSAQTDRMLRGQVATPADLQSALGEKNWYLRDANWDPNFANSARRIAWFIDKELGGGPDVVVAVNWQTLTAALSVFGPVNLPDFGGEIDADNWLAKYQQYSKAESGQSNMMLELARSLMAQWNGATSVQKTQAVSYMLKLLNTRQILISPVSFSAPGLSLVDWQGEVAVPNCRSQHPCQVLQIMAIDSNVGLNRVNPYIMRDHTLQAQVQEDRTDYVYSLNYQNTSPENGWPTGDYKNFLRVYLPKGVVVGEGDYQVAVEGNFVVVKKLITVSHQKSVDIKIKFAQSVPSTDKFHQQIDFINQSGADLEKLDVTFNYPKLWLASPQKRFTVAGAGLLKYNAQIDSPYRLDIDFVKWKNTP